MTIFRKLPIGAEIVSGGVHFRVFAPDHKKVELVIEDNSQSFLYLPMKKEKHGFFSLLTKKVKEGSLYRYRLSEKESFPDPASRFQPQGPVGPSSVINAHYHWSDTAWRGVNPYNQIAYEMHIGTFTEEGTFEAAAKELPYLSDLGITLIEMMPVNEFPGSFGWGYDGVNLFAPYHLYGTPLHLKAFINKAHSLGIGVILDVVYNHLGPECNYLIQFAKEYLSSSFKTEWGKAINFDSPHSREFFLTNAIYWIQEFHFDGLRVDATPWFFCSTPKHILQELTEVVKKAGGKRKTILIGENEPQDTKLLQPYKEGGYGFDILWNDDFHHAARVRLTGKREAYFTDYLGKPQEFVSALKYGFLYQGQYYSWQKNPRGTPSLGNIPYYSMMIFLENHDQVANSGLGIRLHEKTDPGNYKAMIALMLLAPSTPLIFQGQEFNSSKRFCYFADHSTALSQIIHKGRKKELSQFPRLKTVEAQKRLPTPGNPMTFIQCKLDHGERITNRNMLTFFKDLIHLKQKDPVFSCSHKGHIDGAVLSEDAFIIRYFNKEHGDRLLIVNLGADLHFTPAPEPLLAGDQEFKILWSSESSLYGGDGNPPIHIPYLKILGHSAMVLQAMNTYKRSKK